MKIEILGSLRVVAVQLHSNRRDRQEFLFSFT
jgi:hypothetical protein